MKSNNTYNVLLRTTNGVGYSDHPFKLLTQDVKSAKDEFSKHVGNLFLDYYPAASENLEQTVIKKSVTKKSYSLSDGEDNHAVHWYQSVKSKTLFIIDANYCSEIQVIEDCDFSETRALKGLIIIEESHECITASIENDEDQYTHYIFVK